MKRKTLVLLALPLTLALISLAWGLKIHAELVQGLPVFWLAELWPPAAVFTIIVVVCVDYATAAPSKIHKPAKAAKASEKSKRGKAVSRSAR